MRLTLQADLLMLTNPVEYITKLNVVRMTNVGFICAVTSPAEHVLAKLSSGK